MATTKTMLFAILAVLLILSAPLSASAQSMVPDDFDWSIYYQDWDNEWNNWGNNPYDPYSQEPFTYDWYGETHTLYPMYPTYPTYPAYPTVPTPVPQNDFSSNDYVPQPTYPEQQNWNDDGWSRPSPDSDGWFYQMLQGWYDDFENWTGDTQALPESAFVDGFVGYQQSYNLDCEARSAVDMAAWFGVNVNHGEFLYNLPKSDDPNEGFVGSWTDARGHIPPASYGVYQEPIAALLRNYGLNAVGVYAYTQDALKGQIAAGKPVMVWVVGNVEIGYSVPYTPASTGHTTYVVPYQHTVVVTGYDKDNVYIQDGGLRYSRDWNTFLVSWGVLGNRAVYIN